MQRLRQLLDRISDGWVLGILALFGVAAIGVSMGAHVASGQDWYGWWDSLAQNFGAGIIGALVTFLLIDRIIGRREKRAEEQRAARERKRAIIQQMGSQSNDAALEAVRIAGIQGWLEDGSTKGVYLLAANLEGANLVLANLEGADLRFANLERAVLVRANLQGAFLMKANLEGASLDSANLAGADLRAVNLPGAHLWLANLQGANLMSAHFNEDTVLPDDSQWAPDTDLSRFTDPNHLNFWRSDVPNTPAYRGKEGQPQETAGPKKKTRERRKRGGKE